MSEQISKKRAFVAFVGAMLAFLAIFELFRGAYWDGALQLALGVGIGLGAVPEKKPWLTVIQALVIVAALVGLVMWFVTRYFD